MISSTYLYGKFNLTDMQLLIDGIKVCELKIDKAKLLLKELAEESYKTRDSQRILKVTESIDFNKTLIKEYNNAIDELLNEMI